MKLMYLIILLTGLKSADLAPILGQLNDEVNNVFISWIIDDVNITVTITAKCQGWVGLGFSETGAMTGADLVIGWIDNGKAHYQDYHGIANEKPVKDKHNDYDLLSSNKTATHTTLTYRRRLNTCDPEDYPITRDTIKVIFAWTEQIPKNDDDLVYHGADNRAVRPALLFNNAQFEGNEIPQDAEIWDLMTGNVTMPAKPTTYMCRLVQLPDWMRNGKYYYIGRAPAIPKEMKKYIHHLQIQQCNGNVSKFKINEPYDCTDMDLLMDCLQFFIQWGVGGGPYFVPENVGVAVGEKSGASNYWLIQTHYTNPNLDEGLVDTTIFKIYVTSKKRQYDGGSFSWVGLPETKMVIPPKMPAFNALSIVAPECTKERFPKEGIKIFNVLLHTHVKGRQITLRHFRDGVELAPIASDKHYDFNYQQSHEINPPRVVLPGDMLATQCVYNTMEEEKAVLAGLSTKEEMCFCYFQHYPFIDFSGLYGGLEDKDLERFFTDNPKNLTLKELMAEYDFGKFTKQEIKDFQEMAFYGNQSGDCYDNNSKSFRKYQTKLPEIRFPYVEKDVCKKC